MIRSLLQKRRARLLVPVVLLPYVQAVMMFLIPLLLGQSVPVGVGVTILAVLCTVASLVCAVKAMKISRTAAEFAALNLAVKGLQIPAYAFFFFMGILGELLSVIGIWMIPFAFLTDCIVIFCSGLHAVGAVRQMKREGTPEKICALCGIGSFLFCVDVFVAVYMAYTTGAWKTLLAKIKK